MQRYSTKHDDDLRLGSEPMGDALRGGPLRECLAVLNERIAHLTADVRDLGGRLTFADENIADARRRLAVIEERVSHTATKSWVLGCAVALLIATLGGTLGGFWWIVQQYIGPLLRASAS
jgi:hypothetical protein